jgi:hypothetical protein
MATEVIKKLNVLVKKHGDKRVNVLKEFSCETIKRIAPCEIKDENEKTVYVMPIIE